MYLGGSNPHFVYELDNKAIRQVSEEKDLGIVFDSQISFMHILHKANRILALINQCFNTLDSKSFIALYKTLVRPILSMGMSYVVHTTKEILTF